MDSDLIKNTIAGFIRTLITPLAGFLAVNGYLGESDAVKLVAILATLAVALSWSFISKLWAEKKVEVALSLPGGTSKSKLNDVIANQ